MTQTPARRLLTEANGAATYRTAAQVDTQADARIAAKRGVALGVAALGADGIVPAAQLPAASNVPIVARLATGYSATLGAAANAAAATATGLQVDGLTPGLWEVILEGFAYHAAGTTRGYLAAVGGLVAGDSPGIGTTAAATATQSGRLTSVYATSSTVLAHQIALWATANGGSTPLNLSGNSVFSGFRIRGLLRVTTGGSLAVRADSTSSAALGIDGGTYLSATKVA